MLKFINFLEFLIGVQRVTCRAWRDHQGCDVTVLSPSPRFFFSFFLPHRPWIFTYSGLPYTAFRSPPPTVYSSPSWLPTPSAVPPVATPFVGIFAWKFRFDPLFPERPTSIYAAGSPLPATSPYSGKSIAASRSSPTLLWAIYGRNRFRIITANRQPDYGHRRTVSYGNRYIFFRVLASSRYIFFYLRHFYPCVSRK